MPTKDWLDDTPLEERVFGGKLVTAREGFLVGADNYTEMKNMRYSRGGVGVETRYGMRRFNNTAVGTAADIDKVWQHLYTFEQTRYQDLYVVTDERKLYKADSIPESSAGAGSLGDSLYDLSSGAEVPSFCSVGPHAIMSSTKDLIAYSGVTPYPAAILYGTDIGTDDDARDEDDKTFQILSDEVTNNDTSRSVTITLDTQANNEAFYVGCLQPIRGITFDLGTSVNNNAAKMTIEYWTGAAWSTVSLDTGNDTTIVSNATWGQDGTMSWTYIAEGSEQPRRINGLTLFWYRLQVDATLDAVQIIKITTLKDWRALQDLTDGTDILPSGFIWMDDGDDPYNDMLDKVLIDSKGAYASFTDTTADEDIAAADEIYIGFPQRVIGIRLWIIDGYNNDGQASTLTVSYWNGTSWTAYAADEMDDGTSKNSKTFNQTGELRLENIGASNYPSTLPASGIKLPMYWYKLTFSALCYNDANDEIRLWKCRGIPAPKRQSEIENYQWVSEFKQRLFLFGPEGAPNLADFSGYQNPFALSGWDTSSQWPRVSFGNTDEIQCAVKFFNEMIVLKRTEVWMLEGDSPDTFGTLLLDDTVGCVAPQTAKLVRTWVTLPDGRKDFRHAVLFMAHDGVWAADGVRVWKISEDIDNYFNPVDVTTVIKAGYRDESTAFFDPIENEYHLFIWSGSTPTLKEFIFNTEQQKWNGPFDRLVDIVSGASVLDSNDDRQSYGGATDGRLYRLEIGSNDVYTNGTNGAIDNHIEMGDAWTGLLSKYAYRGVFLFGKAQTAGNVNVDFKGDGATTAKDLGNISMIRSGYSTFIGRVNIGDQDSAGAEMENKFHSARVKFSTNTAGVRQVLFGFLVKKGEVGEAASV